MAKYDKFQRKIGTPAAGLRYTVRQLPNGLWLVWDEWLGEPVYGISGMGQFTTPEIAIESAGGWERQHRGTKTVLNDPREGEF